MDWTKALISAQVAMGLALIAAFLAIIAIKIKLRD